jgi:ubiquinone/menaquinone biosynthesis C-methylase UbiE
MRLAILCLVVLVGRVDAASDDATSHQSFADVDHWVSVFDDPKRDAWQKPVEVVRALELRPGMTVADLGAGTGYFSRHLAAAVGAEGTVFAVEPEAKLLAHLRTRAEKEKTPNVVPILGSLDNPRLPHAASDVILIVDTYHHIDDRRSYLRALAHSLAPDGRIAIIDWHKRELPEGPPLDHKLAREQVLHEMTEAGYELAAEPDVLPYQYFLIFRKG